MLVLPPRLIGGPLFALLIMVYNLSMNNEPLYFEDNLGTLEECYGVEFTPVADGKITGLKVWDDGRDITAELSDEVLADIKERAENWFASYLRDAEDARYEIRYNL
jgi:hypothetical protein